MVTTWTNVLNGAATTVGATPGDAVPATLLADVLQISNSGNGLDTTLRDVRDSDGDTIPLQVSKQAVMLPEGAVWPFGDSTFFSAGQTGILIPAYFYPNNPYEDANCLRLLGLIRQYRGRVPCIVILNPGSGPGETNDGNYRAFIRLIQAAGGKVAGYVSTAYAGTINPDRTEAAVKADVDTWLTLYADTPIDTIFFDEMTNVWHNDEYVALYKRYTDYCHARNLAPVIGNPGADSPEEYFSARTADIVVIVESGTWPTEALLRGTADTLGGHLNYKTSLRAALVYGQSALVPGRLRQLARYVQWVYVTEDALSPNPWDSLSTHLEQTFAMLAGGDTISVTDFGAVGDGTTDDATAIQAAIDAANTAGGGTVLLPRGTYLFQTGLILKSGVTLKGAGMGVTTLKIGSSIALTAAGISNATVPTDRTTRTDRNLGLKDLTIDGSARVYVTYLTDPATGLAIADPVTNKTRAPLYSTRGYAARFRRCRDLRIENVELIGHQSLGITDEGCANTIIRGCLFRNNGKIDDTSPAVYVASYGTLRIPVSITNANPAVITLNTSHSFTAASTIYITGVRGMTLADGPYTIASVTSTTITLSGVDTTSAGTFVFSPDCVLSASFYMPSEDCLVTDNQFRNNNRSGIIFSPRGGILSNNVFSENGESTVFSSYSYGVQILNNRIRKTTVTDITADAIELNYCGSVKISGNHIQDTDTSGISVLAVVGFEITDNTIINPFRTAANTYKYGPFAEAWTGSAVGAGDVAGTALGEDRMNFILVENLNNYPTEAGLIEGNKFIENRTTPLATSGIMLSKVTASNKIAKLSIINNDFQRCGIADTTRLLYYIASSVLPGSTVVRGNRGHASEFPVTKASYTSVGTGAVTFDFGFTPSLLLVEAVYANTTNFRRSSAHVARSGTSNAFGTIGNGVRVSIDSITTTPTAANESYDNSVIVITSAAAANLNVCKFSAWTNTGVTLDWTTHSVAVRVIMTAFP